MSKTITNIRQATLDARVRTGDDQIATSIEGGMYRVERIIPKGRTCDVIPLSGHLSAADTIKFLNDL